MIIGVAIYVACIYFIGQILGLKYY